MSGSWTLLFSMIQLTAQPANINPLKDLFVSFAIAT